MEEKIKNVAKEFDIKTTKKIRKLRLGKINQTYHISSSEGEFIIQMLNPIFNSNATDISKNVGPYLRTNGLQVPVLLRTSNGSHSINMYNSQWRVFEYIPNDEIDEDKKEVKIVEEAAMILGKFHRLMSKFESEVSESLEGFHDIDGLFGELNDLYNSESLRKNSYYFPNDEIFFIIKNLPKHFIKNKSPDSIIHADARLQNILFRDKKAIAFIDLDTLMKGNPLIDIGDGFRNLCRKNNSFDNELFSACLRGYRSQTSCQFSENEIRNAIALFTLELAGRFCKYYFSEEFFPLDRKRFSSLKEQNLHYVRKYIEYYKTLF